MKHQNHIHNARLIVKEEETRRQRVTKQVLLDENSKLREQLAEKEAELNQLSVKFDETLGDLDSVKATNRDQETQLKAQKREFDHIKVGVHTDSAAPDELS